MYTAIYVGCNIEWLFTLVILQFSYKKFLSNSYRTYFWNFLLCCNVTLCYTLHFFIFTVERNMKNTVLVRYSSGPFTRPQAVLQIFVNNQIYMQTE